MKRLSARFLAVFAASMMFVSSANAAPFQFGFFGMNAPEGDVGGVRLSVIYGPGGGNVTGWDWNLLSYSEIGSLTGVQTGWFLPSGGRIKGDMTGVALNWFNWQEGNTTGVNLGIFNLTNNTKGLNWSAFNLASGYSMVDLGLVNISGKSNFQLSFVNITDTIAGLQIGILNCASNGFLPCFIIFNFGSEGG